MKHIPHSWTESAETAQWWECLRKARRSVLMLDYDGTLAPFTTNRLEAYPYPAVGDRLATLAGLSSVRLVLVSGRPARELKQLLGQAGPQQANFEIWGNHGREHLESSGAYRFFPLEESEAEILEQMRICLAQRGFSRAIEMKPASLAFHWRGFASEEQKKMRQVMEESARASLAGNSSLELLPFDGGLELRSKARTKGTVARQVLEEETGLPVAYLGDDLTDEDAFAALKRLGISILVSPGRRESLADYWIKPPVELVRFLDDWILSSQSQATGRVLPAHEAAEPLQKRQEGGR